MEIYDSFTASVDADLYILAHATSPFNPRRDRRRSTRKGLFGRIRLGIQAAEKLVQDFLHVIRGQTSITASTTSPDTDHRAGLRRNQRFFHLLTGVVAQPRPAHRRAALHGLIVDHIEGLDIDYPEDFTMAEIIAASRNLQP